MTYVWLRLAKDMTYISYMTKIIQRYDLIYHIWLRFAKDMAYAWPRLSQKICKTYCWKKIGSNKVIDDIHGGGIEDVAVNR